jgi:hypothetical protein
MAAEFQEEPTPTPQQRVNRGATLLSPQRQVNHPGAHEWVGVTEVIAQVQSRHQPGEVTVGVRQLGEVDNDVAGYRVRQGRASNRTGSPAK